MWFSILLLALVGWVSSGILPRPRRNHGPNAVSIDSFSLRLGYLFSAPSILASAFKMYGFKTITFTTIRGRHQVLLSSDELLKELSTAPQSIISAAAWSRHIVQFDYMIPGHYIGNKLPPSTVTNFKYLNVSLTRNLASFVPRLREEVEAGINRMKGHAQSSGRFHTISLYESTMDLVVRAATRVLVGTPLCHDEEFLDAMAHYLPAVGTGGFLVSMFPKPLKWWAANYLTGVRQPREILTTKLKALAKAHQANIEHDIDKLGAVEASKLWDDHGDLFYELIRASITRGKFSVDDSIVQVQGTALAAMHTTAFSITVALAELSTRPEYHDELREEIQSIVLESGWTRKSLENMSRLDSFMMESIRHWPLSCMTMSRIALQEYRFADGTTVFPGDHVAGFAEPRYKGWGQFEEPESFHGFRFHRMRNTPQGKDLNFTNTNNMWWPLFGHGNHPCPGRFWAEMLTKLVVGHMLLEFDFPLDHNRRVQRKSFEESTLPLKEATVTVTARGVGRATSVQTAK